jgi:dipeptidyl aminopeptidase/acylaminoacyl peptidase
MPTTAPYGTWISPLSARSVAAGGVALSRIVIDGDDIYWLERRPEEGGRSVVVVRGSDGRIADVTPAGTNVRTRVHEYGGGAYTVSRGITYFSEFADQRVYRLERGGVPEPLTPPGKLCYADYTADPARPRLVCVREDHTAPDREAVNTLVSLALDGSSAAGAVIASGHDFYSSPCFNPDGSRLAWLAWRHPDMPWDNTELWTAAVAPDGRFDSPTLAAGGGGESIFQPGWSPDGTLYFVSDRTDWWNLYRVHGGQVEAVHPMAAESGRPQWVFGTSTWAFADESRMVSAYLENGSWRLATLNLVSGALVPIDVGVECGDNLAATATHVIFVGSSPRDRDAVVRVTLATGAVETIRVASTLTIDPGFLSIAEAFEFPASDGLTAHAFYYRPCNRDFTPPTTERPPLIVVSHGGPTAMHRPALSLEVQYWTSRGFAVVGVNYGGSTGYGRAYRERLNGQWGVVDVADCVNAAAHLAADGRADADRLIIRGNSAGGYTTLAALVFRPDVFKAGSSYYGISDLETMTRDTHKFESRYLDRLVGPYPARRDVYRARSPIHFVDRLSCPLILFQGLEDQVVPPDQSQTMADAVRAKGLPVALLAFEGEQHGFRRADTIVRCLEGELFFYGVVFGFTPADAIAPVPIDNLDGWKPPSHSATHRT